MLGVVAMVGVALLLIGTAFAVLSWLFGGRDGWLDADRNCNDNQFSCGVVVEIVPTVLALAASFALFLYWRVRRVTWTHLRNAVKEPWSLVPTATKMDVVGRQEICRIIERDLHHSAGRRAQIIVGGIGEGKTAVLVGLTEELARRGAVPVAIRLGDATDTLDFSDLAKRQFIDRVNQRLLTEDEGDKVWRRLCRDDRVVVLADGLEEALHDKPGREAVIRSALAEAKHDKLPLVITSRPDEALRGLNAAVIRLEPLAEREIVHYLRREPRRDGTQMAALAEVAQLSESPLYLRLADDLEVDALNGVPVNGRISARVELLDRWRTALADGSIRGEMHVPEDREDALTGLERIASLGLREGTFELDEEDIARSKFIANMWANDGSFRLSANVGEDLGVVDRRGPKVRFRHGVVEAYLGARALPALIDGSANEAYLADSVLQSSRKELLIALVIASYRSEEASLPSSLCRRLRQAAASDQAKDRFALLATAWEIASMTEGADTQELAEATQSAWSDDADLDPRRRTDPMRLTESKLLAVARMEEVPSIDTFRALWEVAASERAYSVRLRAAQALASGGVQAHAAIRVEIDSIIRDARSSPADQWSRADDAEVRRWSLLGWILPSLWASCESSSDPDVGHVRQSLEAWVEIAAGDFHLGAQSCLAQGFKYEANRLLRDNPSETRAPLIKLCEAVLERSEWWYTQISLLQALALWSLGTDSTRAADLRELVDGWTGRDRQPYVREVAGLCVEAIDDRRNAATPDEARPGRYIWIDETGVALKIGTQSAVSSVGASGGVWISQAAGWHTLKESARQLVGEILVFLNLIEVGAERPARPPRANDVQRREARRRDVRAKERWLPPCMVRAGHGGLLPDEGQEDPCTCDLHLCPYPSRRDTPFRGELGETFCRQQKRLVLWRESGVPSWHERRWYSTVRRRSTIASFWTKMEKRARELSERSLVSRSD